jgi:hypothetical protein
MSAVQLHILQHALGLNEFGLPKDGQRAGHRNYFVTGEGSTDFPHCVALVQQGLMTQTHGNSITGGDDVFRVTEAGKQHVAEHSPQPPKLTRSERRYDDFLREDSSLTFGDWLRAQKHRRAYA